MKTVFLDAAVMGDASMAPIEKFGEYVSYPSSTPEQALERVLDCDILIVNKVKVDERLLCAAPKLKLICEAATGVDNIDLKAAESHSVTVRNVSGYSTDTVVQTTFMHMLSLVGNAPYYDNRVKSGVYSNQGQFCDLTHSFNELSSKRLGIIGMGAIGSKVAAIASTFGMTVNYFSTSGTSHCKDYPSVSLEQLLSESDIVTIHAPLNERTRNLISEPQLSLMKGSAFLLNMGRGGIVDESALCAAVDSGVIRGAAMDVYSTEPLPASSPLMHVAHPERFRFSPHIAWGSIEARARLVDGIARNISDFLSR